MYLKKYFCAFWCTTFKTKMWEATKDWEDLNRKNWRKWWWANKKEEKNIEEIKIKRKRTKYISCSFKATGKTGCQKDFKVLKWRSSQNLQLHCCLIGKRAARRRNVFFSKWANFGQLNLKVCFTTYNNESELLRSLLWRKPFRGSAPDDVALIVLSYRYIKEHITIDTFIKSSVVSRVWKECSFSS